MASSSGRVFGKVFGPLMAAAKSSAAHAAANAPTATTKTVRRPAGILQPMKISPVLAKFLGVPEASRADAVRKVWQHIKQNNLQNPQNKKEIICDEKLKIIFDGKDKVGFLEIARLLGQHFVKS